MNDLTPFDYSGRPVRVVLRSGEPWFVASDVCSVLGYANGRAAIEQHVPLRHRDSVAIHDGTPGNPNRTIISESGLFRLTLRSNALHAEQFQDWVTDEVLPSIRKTGTFGAPRELSRLELIDLAREAEVGRLAAEQKVAELAPSAAAWDTLADTGADYSAREAAFILNRDPAITTGQNRLLNWLRHNRVIGMDGRPYASHAAHVTLRPQTRLDQATGERVPARPQVRITVAGLRYLHKRLGGTAQLDLTPVPEGLAS